MNETLAGKTILEVGLGYGTLGEALARRSGHYYGLDIAEGPAEMMRYRLSNSGFDWRGKVQVGSILDAPYKECSFDYVYSIGCLHHSGNLGGAISEVHRLLKAGGKAIIMLYNKHSFRLLIQVPLMRFLGFLSGKNKGIDGAIRGIYDANSDGMAAPHTDFISPSQARNLFRKYSSVKIDIRNFDNYSLRGKTILKRKYALDNVGRVLGLDLYITATK
jgi:SAM-dependent methyltransferase